MHLNSKLGFDTRLQIENYINLLDREVNGKSYKEIKDIKNTVSIRDFYMLYEQSCRSFVLHQKSMKNWENFFKSKLGLLIRSQSPVCVSAFSHSQLKQAKSTRYDGTFKVSQFINRCKFEAIANTDPKITNDNLESILIRLWKDECGIPQDDISIRRATIEESFTIFRQQLEVLTLEEVKTWGSSYKHMEEVHRFLKKAIESFARKLEDEYPKIRKNFPVAEEEVDDSSFKQGCMVAFEHNLKKIIDSKRADFITTNHEVGVFFVSSVTDIPKNNTEKFMNYYKDQEDRFIKGDICYKEFKENITGYKNKILALIELISNRNKNKDTD